MQAISFRWARMPVSFLHRSRTSRRGVSVKDPVLVYLEGGGRRAAGGRDDLVDRLHSEPHLISRVVLHLNGPDARVRSEAARVLAELAEELPELVAAFVPELAQALENEESATRLAATRAIAAIAAHRPAALEDDFDTIRLGLFDPLNPDIRAKAAEAIAQFGRSDAAAARRVFPHLAEALRRFHDQDRPAELFRCLGLLARASDDPALRNDIWRAARRHEKHEDPVVRAEAE